MIWDVVLNNLITKVYKAQKHSQVAFLSGRFSHVCTFAVMPILQVQHREVIQQPVVVAQRIAAFLGGDLDSERMAAAVEPGLYRQRRKQSPPEPLAKPPLLSGCQS